MPPQSSTDASTGDVSSHSCLGRRSVWLTWETQRRNEELAASFGSDFRPFDYSRCGRLSRYLRSAAATLAVLYRGRYELVFVQCPSIVLCLLAVIYRRVRRVTLVVDAHNVFFEYLSSKRVVLRLMARAVLRDADCILVSNQRLAGVLRRQGACALVLPDKLPALHGGEIPERLRSFSKPWIVLIASYADDEPIEEFIQGMIDSGVGGSLLVTGRRSRAGDLLRYESDRICFTDFLTRGEFDALLSKAQLVADLTLREDCLVCGAYEALAAGTPALLSDTNALRETFPRGTIFAENSRAGYAAALQRFVESREEVAAQVIEQRAAFTRAWTAAFEEVCERLEEQASQRKPD